jgi:hypothetical protein
LLSIGPPGKRTAAGVWKINLQAGPGSQSRTVELIPPLRVRSPRTRSESWHVHHCHSREYHEYTAPVYGLKSTMWQGARVASALCSGVGGRLGGDRRHLATALGSDDGLEAAAILDPLRGTLRARLAFEFATALGSGEESAYFVAIGSAFHTRGSNGLRGRLSVEIPCTRAARHRQRPEGIAA